MILSPIIIKPPLLPGIKILLIVLRKNGEAGGTTIHVTFGHNSTMSIRFVQIKPRPVSTGEN